MCDTASKEDQAVRHSIWKCYKHKCHYCKKFIEFKDMQIDHIIPSIYRREPERLTLALRSIGKEEGFEIDSLQNFIPACSTCNGDKGDSFNKQQILLALEKTEKQVPNIKKEIARYRKSIELGKKAAFTRSDIEAGSTSIEELYNFLADDQEEFEDMEHSNYKDIGSSNWYVYSKKNVKLDAFLPRHYDDMSVSCAFSFRTIRIRGCTIALGHKEILDTLFPGLNTDLKLGFREFIIGTDYSLNGYYIVQLAGNRFLVTSEEANNLCQIIDDFMKAYIESIRKLEKSLGTGEFELSEKFKNGFRLLKVPGWLWRNIIEFANNFDYEAGDSPWNIFSRSGGKLIVCTGENMKEKFDYGVHAVLHAEWASGYSSLYPNDEVWIIWKPGGFIERDLTNFNMRQYWSPEFILNWLMDELIPYVVYHFKQEEKLWFGKKSFQDFMRDFDIKAYISHIPNSSNLNYISIRNIDGLTSLIELLCDFYIIDQCYFKGEDLYSLYTAIRLCFIHIKMGTDDYYHAIHSLNFVEGSTLKDILKGIKNHEIKIAGEYVSSKVAHNALVCLLSLLNNCKNRLNEPEVQLIFNYIEPLSNFYQTKKIVDKYRNYKGSLR
jgi:5-methylcytosine-specific restriction endonuclease McrA